ncbi:MAG: hypothetical protein KGH49_02910 [Candidatus Micrarchaeota archaeon]|nr:hypothetical protein [Candidatus Micrarchaeota archaeon]
MKKTAQEKLDALEKAGLLHDAGSEIKYPSKYYYWNDYHRAMWDHPVNVWSYLPKDPKHMIDAKIVQGSINALNDISANIKTQDPKFILGLLEKEFDIKISQEAKNKIELSALQHN